MRFGYMGIGVLARAVTQFAVLILSSRLFAPEVVGEAAVAFAIYYLLWPMIEVGIGQTLIQTETTEHDDKTEDRTLSALLAYAAVGLLAFCVLAGLWSTSDPFLLPPTAWALITATIAIRALGTLSAYSLLKSIDIRRFAFVDNGAYVLGAVGGLVLAWLLDAGALYLLLGVLLYSVVSTTLFLSMARPARPLWGIRYIKPVLATAAGFTIASGLNSFVREIGVVLVQFFIDTATAGIFNRAFLLYMLGAFTIGQVFDRVLTPVLRRHREEPGYNQQLFDVATLAIFAVLLPVATVIGLEADVFVSLLFGNEWAAVAVPLSILAFGLAFRAGAKINEAALRAYKRPYERVAYYLVWSIVLVVAAPLVWRFGLVGFATAEVVGAVLFWGLAFHGASRLVGTNRLRLLRMLVILLAGPIVILLVHGALSDVSDIWRVTLEALMSLLCMTVGIWIVVKLRFGGLRVLRELL